MIDPRYIGLTGGIGSGKSAASGAFEQRGIVVVDADVVAREVVEPGKPALQHIAEYFGAAYITSNGNLDRARLRQRIFDHPQDKDWLEALLHPLIREEIIQQLAQATSPYVILVSPLLFETNQHQLVSKSILIDVPEALQIERASSRDANSAEQIKKIMANQMPRAEKRSRADIIIDNSGSISDLHAQVEKVHQQLLHNLPSITRHSP